MSALALDPVEREWHDKRIERGRLALDSLTERYGFIRSEDAWHLVIDLLHLVDSVGGDPEDTIRSARQHWLAERPFTNEEEE